MRQLFQRYRRCFIVTALVLSWWAACFSAVYIVRWQPRMEAGRLVLLNLREQGAGRWFGSMMREAECFPVRTPFLWHGDVRDRQEENASSGVHLVQERKAPWSFEDGYGEGRSYGGARKHEGIDIMSVSGKRGELKVQAVSDGIVEQLGWLELGGYRVGIRGDSGLYYYYAHLDAYAPGLRQGERVRAGTLLGYMGDTGYGSEGTRGKFPVHLHFGIYYDEDGEEKSLDPYYLLLHLGSR